MIEEKINTYQCDKHGTEHRHGEYCLACMEAFINRRDAATMTGEERAAEFRWWGDVLTIPFNNLHQRITELVGRPVFIHELAGQGAVDLLIDEARTQQHISIVEVIDKLPQDKIGIVLVKGE